jgi:hypothetical protein
MESAWKRFQQTSGVHVDDQASAPASKGPVKLQNGSLLLVARNVKQHMRAYDGVEHLGPERQINEISDDVQSSVAKLCSSFG